MKGIGVTHFGKEKVSVDFITQFTDVRGYHEVEMDKLIFISRNIKVSGNRAYVEAE